MFKTDTIVFYMGFILFNLSIDPHIISITLNSYVTVQIERSAYMLKLKVLTEYYMQVIIFVN